MLSNLWQGFWECRRVGGTHTRDKGEKDRKLILSLYTCCEFQPDFSFQRCGQIIWRRQNLNGVNRWPGWFLAWFFPPYIGALFPTVPSHSVHDPQLTHLPGVGLRPKYLPSLCTSPQPWSICLKKNISYPMHVSGHGMVEWVQRHACAKLSGTVWLAGGWVFHGGDQLYKGTCLCKLKLDAPNTNLSRVQSVGMSRIEVNWRFQSCHALYY